MPKMLEKYHYARVILVLSETPYEFLVLFDALFHSCSQKNTSLLIQKQHLSASFAGSHDG